MSRRSTPQHTIDEAAFPVRVTVLVPDRGFGNALNALLQWLIRELGATEFAHHAASSLAGDAVAFYFRTVEDADSFVRAHPQVALADGTMSPAYRSPLLQFGREEIDVCNLYAMTRTQDEMRRLFDQLAAKDNLGNMEPRTDIYPDYPAPILRNGPDGREMVMARWGMPTPPQFLEGKKTDRGVTNIRNTRSPHWRRWLGTEHRCLAPFTRFSEPDVRTKQKVGFALPDDQPAFFAGIWTQWTSVRKLKDGETTDDVYGFLTCPPNAEVAAVHSKPMPVILTEPDDREMWLTASWKEAAELQLPMADGRLRRASA